MRILSRLGHRGHKGEKGFSLIELVVGLAILGLIGLGFPTAFGTGLKALTQTDELATAKNLAESQLEYAKSLDYDTGDSYPPAGIPDEFSGYSAAISAEPIASRDANIQKITVTISHAGQEVLALQGYKVHR